MDLLNEKREQPVEKSKGKKIVLILLILSIIGAIGIGILISFLKANKVIPNTLYINGEKKEISNTLFVSDKNGNKYMNLKELAELLGYKFDNSEYQKYDLDTTKCYIANGKLISGFEMDSNKIYKYEEEVPFEIHRENNIWVLTGPKIEELFKMTRFTEDESVMHFAYKLKKMGVDEKLEELGAKRGDEVKIMDYIFNFKE